MSALPLSIRKSESEGGCGVIGIACSEKIAGRHLLSALCQMRNRGNGKGGGIAAVGLVPEELGVTQKLLEHDYLLTVAYLDKTVRSDVFRTHIDPIFEIDHIRHVQQPLDGQQFCGLEVQPPEVYQYFVRVREDLREQLRKEYKLDNLSLEELDDEIVYRNSFRLSQTFYAAEGEKRAFVLSHGKNMFVLKLVGYGDDVIRYYQLENMHAHVWIGHHRYPTKGKVWHPGGAHPFVGLHEALVHNGDFANYYSLCEYLAQRNMFPLFLTDTEVGVLLFDLFHRVYKYPLEYVIEALAPTTERDFTLLPEEKQRIYKMLQGVHIHGSPDGPWFFLIASSEPARKENEANFRLIGITDTSMLRPQVFALQEGQDGNPAVGLAASEKQAIDAVLESLSKEDHRFWSRADLYWNARGGSHTDGGAFIFTVNPRLDRQGLLTCTDKFGKIITIDKKKRAYSPDEVVRPHIPLRMTLPIVSRDELFLWFTAKLPRLDFQEVLGFLETLELNAKETGEWSKAIAVLTDLVDRRYPTGAMRRSSLLTLFDRSLTTLFQALKKFEPPAYCWISSGRPLPEHTLSTQTVIIDASGFSAQGDDSLARTIARLVEHGAKHILVIHTKGHRFIGNGLGPNTHDVRIDVYGSPGDYLASGIDGAKIFVHASGQDQLAQIMKDGTLVVYGDVGQTFMYAAKGGKAFMLGNTAGRPLINAVGKPKVVINGTCLDYLAESFMAGDPLHEGGLVIVNGISFDEDGQLVELETPYPGGNLFSLSSGGAIYIRDPKQKVCNEQLNGGEFTEFTIKDWDVIKHYLEENERLFGIAISRLLQVDGKLRSPEEVFRKIRPKRTSLLHAEEAWIKRSSQELK